MSSDEQKLYDPHFPPGTDATAPEQKLYDPHMPPSDGTAPAYPPPGPAPMYQPQAFPNQPAPSYQPVPVAQQSSTNTTVAVVNTAPTAPSTFIVNETMPPNYVVLNIFTLICCCWIFGLIGLIYSLQVETEWARGNRYGAHNASTTAKNWGMAGIITGIFITVGVFLLIVISAAVNASSSKDDN